MARRPAVPALLLAALLLAFVLAPAAARAAEVITAYDSRVAVGADGGLDVTETISVIAEGDRIRRGIYRDFPTVRGRTWWGAFRVGFDVTEVLRDGAPEPWFTQDIADGVRLYIGSEDRALSPGPHTYTLRYRTDRQIGFFPDHDELYWNVTGNRWAFPIADARAVVTLPPGAQALAAEAYAGALGAAGPAARDGAAVVSRGGAVEVAATRPLAAGEGLTVAVTWPKGAVRAPTARERLAHAVRDLRGIIAGFAGLLAAAAFYAVAWARYGRDPAAGTLVAQYDPPQGLSPAACRYVARMGWDRKVLTAALVSLAARGFVTLEKEDDAIVVAKTARAPSGGADGDGVLSSGERAVLRKLFAGGVAALPLRKENHAAVQAAIAGLRRTLDAEHDHVHFLKNRGIVAAGWAFSLAALAAMVLLAPDRLPEIVVGLLAGAVIFLIYGLMRRFSFGGGAWSTVLKIGLFVGAQLGLRLVLTTLAGVVALPTIADMLNVVLGPAAIIATALILINIFFLEAMKAPTHIGRKVMDHIDGFRHYLTVAEKDRLDFHNPPALTPQRFEAYLPYAIALDVETAWGAQFDAAMHRAAAEGIGDAAWSGRDYAPRWYAGGRGGRDLGAAMSGMTSALTASVATAATAPSQGGGGASGGGFSGGGGGGGGGGGW